MEYRRPALCLALPALLALPSVAHAGMPGELPSVLAEEVQQLAGEATRSVAGNMQVRIAVEVGQLDPRLKLAACDRVQPYLPTGSKPWGKTRIGLRCAEGSTRWNVFLPVTVHVFGRSLVAAGPLPAGAVLAESDLLEGEVDLAAAPGAPVGQKSGAVGRTLARPLAPGDALRQTDLRARQWFAAGETVRVDVQGGGYAVSTEGQALSPGIEGQPVRVRTGSGRIVSGQAVGERRVELSF